MTKIVVMVLCLCFIGGSVYAIQDEKEKAVVDKASYFTTQGMYNKAIDELSKFIQDNPDAAGIYNERGVVHYTKGDLNKAILDYNKAIAINPNSALYYSNRGLAYGGNHIFDEAYADFNKAIEIAPDDATIYYNRALVYSDDKQYDKSWDDVHKAESLGFQFDPELIKVLKKRSGKK